ncbi:MAG: Signal peptidase [Pedosphaera sp.]|nr:Signal peptidase [Pedosphaera sp.]
MQKHVHKMLEAQRDILSPQAVNTVKSALNEIQKAIKGNVGDEALKVQMTNLEAAANKWLKPYPNSGIRENVEVLLVALAVAMGIRTFFVQPFKIPTGSMQPTLFGVTSANLKSQPDVKIPGALTRLYQACIQGKFYHHAVAADDGEVTNVGLPEHVFRFINKITVYVHYKSQSPGAQTPITFWFAPDDHFVERAGIEIGEPFHKGDDIVKFEETAGDHLFVDRLTYNFRHPKRGEIIVFETRGIPRLPPDQFYIKRMVALGGERVQIGQDRHLVIDGKRLDASTPHFERVYSFDPATLARESHFSGHVNDAQLAPLFVDNPEGVTVRPNHYMVMGDNTVNSYDSRAWGDFSRTNVIGRYCFVYWPFSQRFGGGAR